MPENNLAEAVTLYVGVGASAGGLEAIEAFFSRMPEKSGIAFIVIQHLSPDYKSLMVELLSKKTRIPVHRSTDGMRVEPDNIYMIPPKKNLTIYQGRLILKDKDSPQGVNLPIDIFLTSLAEDQREKAIAVILSGTGSDGTRGVRAIKEHNGLVMVQNEASAKFDGMPRAAISTGLVDFILPPEKMADQLMAFLDHPYAAAEETEKKLLEDEQGMAKIFALLRDRTRVDFTYYKFSTISRRIERRMIVNQIPCFEDYIAFIQKYPVETMTLYRELLIGVTHFFRDPEAMNELMVSGLPDLIQRAINREIRFWIPGCSTGEEAYTLAILTKEVMEAQGNTRDVKIFATDLDRDAVIQAGNGIYPESIAADVNPRLLGKYFYRKGDHYQIARHIREMVVFAQHNLIQDPPFTKIDLISCRNLLIYLQPVLQKKIMALFNFSLNPGGILFLGTSETVGDLSDCFETLHARFKLFRSLGKHPAKPLSADKPFEPGFPAKEPAIFTYTDNRYRPTRTEDSRMMERYLSILETRFVPLSAIVNEAMEILHVFGEPQGYFKLPSGKIIYDITKMTGKDLSIPLATGIQKAFRTRQEQVYHHIKLNHQEDIKTIRLRIIPLPDQKGHDPLVAVFIEETGAEPDNTIDPVHDVYDISADVHQRIKDLEMELQFAKENLQATIEELETSNEELQATNEELLAGNEELQSTNEELQSTNEELFTVNSEYQNKIIELTEMNNDVENLLSNSGIDILILDENHEIRKYSPSLTRIFNVLDKDLGRPIHHLSHHIMEFDPLTEAMAVYTSKKARVMEKEDRNGLAYLIRALPYHVGPNTYSGTLFTFVDISELKQARHDLQKTRQMAQDIFLHMKSGLLIYRLNEQNELVLESGNRKAELLTGIDIQASRGRLFTDLWTATKKTGLADAFVAVVETGKAFFMDDLRYEYPERTVNYWVTAFALPDRQLAVLFQEI